MDDMGKTKWVPLSDYPGVRVQLAQVNGRVRIVGVQVQRAEGVTLEQLQVPVHRIEAAATERFRAARAQVGAVLSDAVEGEVTVTTERPPNRHELRIPKRLFAKEGRSYPTGFYEKVADLYSWCVVAGTAPAPAIADANDVPVTSVRRWVREARARRVLAPARTAGGRG
jgi:hypothetical protein